MAKIDSGNRYKQKWWLHPMDPENLVELNENDRKNAKSFNHWTLIWGLTFFGVVLGIEPLSSGVQETPVWRLILIISPVIPGIFLVRAFVRLFSEMNDELIKKIYYEALSAGFLFAFFIGMCFQLSALIVGASVKAGPVMFGGLLAGYFIGLFLRFKKYNE